MLDFCFWVSMFGKKSENQNIFSENQNMSFAFGFEVWFFGFRNRTLVLVVLGLCFRFKFCMGFHYVSKWYLSGFRTERKLSFNFHN